MAKILKLSFKNNFFNDPCYIVNIDRCKDRYEFAINNVKSAGFRNIQRFKGIDAKVDDLDKAWEAFGSPVFNQNHPNFINLKGHQGCMLSHLYIWDKMIKENIERVTVFEDDVRFHSEWHNIVDRFIQNTPDDFDILYIGSQMDMHSPYAITVVPVYCTHAYVITLAGAKKILNLILNTTNGVYTIDCMLIKYMYEHMQNQKFQPFIWYVWNATMIPDKGKTDKPSVDKRNCGLVFQDDQFESEVSKYD
jgi:GR25 family glycosyltransferase involved in LPS biosynthesis